MCFLLSNICFSYNVPAAMQKKNGHNANVQLVAINHVGHCEESPLPGHCKPLSCVIVSATMRHDVSVAICEAQCRLVPKTSSLVASFTAFFFFVGAKYGFYFQTGGLEEPKKQSRSTSLNWTEAACELRKFGDNL